MSKVTENALLQPICVFLSKPFHVALFLKMKLLDLHQRHPTCPLKGMWGLLIRESRNAETAI